MSIDEEQLAEWEAELKEWDDSGRAEGYETQAFARVAGHALSLLIPEVRRLAAECEARDYLRWRVPNLFGQFGDLEKVREALKLTSGGEP